MNGLDLTELMRRNGILRISDTSPRGDGSSWAVYLKGNICGTGLTVGDAYQAALDTRALQNMRKAA